MMKKLFTLISVLISLFSVGQTIEREVIGALGGTVIEPSIQVDYTVGEVAISTFSQSNVILTQGFIQQDDLSSVAIKEIDKGIFSIYPNPFENRFYIQGVSSGQITIVNALGVIVYRDKIETFEIDTENLASGLYFITVGNTTLKCIKN